MKKVLIVGAGIEQVPAIQIAAKLGYEVHTVDYNPNSPGFAHAHHYEVISTTDEEGIFNYVSRNQINGLTTVASETAIPTIARVAARTGLSGMSPETALAATNKDVMRKAVLENGIAVPQFIAVSNYQEAVPYLNKVAGPWVIKPSDSSGQRGMALTSNKEQVKAAIEAARQYAKDGKAMIEEFIQGPEVNVTAVVRNGEIDILSLSHRITEPDRSFGVAIRHLFPVNLTRAMKQAVSDMSVQAIRAIGLENGIAYPQIIVTPDGPRFIEIAARMPGGNMREVAWYSSGIDMIKAQILIAMGKPFTLDEIREAHFPSVYVRFITHHDFPQSEKPVQRIDGIDEARKLEGIKSCYVHLLPGDFVPPLNNGLARFGGVIAVGGHEQEAIQRAERAAKKVKIIF